MSSGTQIEVDWTRIELPSPNGDFGGQARPDSPNGGFGEQGPPANIPNGTGAAARACLTDEEILGIEPAGSKTPLLGDVIPSETRNLSSSENRGREGAQRDSSGKNGPRNDNGQISAADAISASMPQWMQVLAGDPKNGAEAQQLWREHRAFRASFSSPEEARTIKELFPGGAQEAQTLKQASQSVDRIDAAIFSGDARAQSEVVAELARANPAAFRSLFAEAAKVLAGMGSPTQAAVIPNEVRNRSSIVDPSEAGTQRDPSADPAVQGLPRNDIREGLTNQPPQFDPVAYSNFERETNEAVARDVRSTIGETLSRVLPEGLADGAARRVGEDIFNEIHRALAVDRALSEQVGEALRVSLASGQGWRFGSTEQQRVASLLAGRARQLVPSVARRVIGEWTSSVLGTARTKAARQATAASRVDIAAAGGSLDSTPLRAMSPREVNYASMSDDDILGM